MKLLLLLTLSILGSIGSLHSQTETWYTARVTGLTDQTKETDLNNYFGNQSDVLLFRADYRTETILLSFNNAQTSEAAIVALLETQGIGVICTVIQDNGTNIRQKLFSKCFKEEEIIEPQIQKQ